MNKSTLSTSALAFITISAILNLRGIPAMAELGFDALWLYLIAAIGFLIPSTLVCATLAKTHPQAGGVYQWVKLAFGRSAGFLAIWMEWTNNLIAVPATLATILTTVAFVVYPNFAQHKFIFFLVMAALYWLCTAFNCLGIKTSSRFNTAGALIGTLLPGVLIIGLGAAWLISGHPLASTHHTSIHVWGNLAFLISAISGYSGMQITAFHAPNVSHPQRQFPLALMLACVAILFLSIGSALAMAAVLPASHINLIDGVIQSFGAFFSQFHIGFLTPVLAICIAFGALACMSAWLIGPARGLHASAMNGDIPKFFKRQNRQGMPTGILLTQACVATVLMSLYLFLPSIQLAFWFLIVITSQFTILMYLMVFASAIVLSPGRRLIQAASVIGFITLSVAFMIGLIPPASLHIQHTWEYISAVGLVDLALLGLPVLAILRISN